MKRIILFLFLLLLPTVSAYSIDLNAIDINYTSTSTFAITIRCSSGFPSEFSEGDLVDFAVWYCSSVAKCREVLGGNFVFEPECIVREEFSFEVNDNNIGLFAFSKRHQDTVWKLQQQAFFYEEVFPLFTGSALPFVPPEIVAVSLFWLLPMGLALLLLTLILFSFRKKLGFLTLFLGAGLIAASIFFG